MTSNPRVIIGIPVYNGENYLREAVESVLTQTFTDFQLVISDNASTDATPDICYQYAKRDNRVIHVRQGENIGAAPNHNYLFMNYGKDAPYFKWQAHDDTIEPDYLKRCVELLDADTNSSLAIAHCRAVIINEHGTRVSTCDHEVRLSGKSPSDRFWRLLWAGYFTEVFGLMRSSMVRGTKLQGSFAGADRNFVAEMILQGDVGYVEDYLFARRDHPDCYCRLKDTETKHLWFDSKAKKEMLKYLGLHKSKVYLSAIATLPIPTRERFRCAKKLMQWTLQRGIESATGVGERFGDRFREEFAANREWATELHSEKETVVAPEGCRSARAAL